MIGMNKKVFLFVTAALYLSCLTACHKETAPKEEKTQKREIQKDGSQIAAEKEVLEKGYDLPISQTKREEAERDCKNAMEKIKGPYMADRARTQEAAGGSVSEDTALLMQESLKTLNCPILAWDFQLNMMNYEVLDAFLSAALKGWEAEVTVYEIYPDGGLGRKAFTYDGKEMYLLYANGTWNDRDEPSITATTYSRIKKWEYTEKGWFCFERCVPEPPEVSEIVMGTAMMRVKPVREEYLAITKRFLDPIGYQGNNLFCTNWDAEHMEELDYNGLFQYLYEIKHQQRFSSDQYPDGIPAEEFESLIREYLPISAENLREYAVYCDETDTYDWLWLGCGNYTLNTFATSSPEITGIRENEDGTTVITIDAVCESAGNEAMMTHELTVSFLEGGGIRYLGNQILGEGKEKTPQYQYRVRRE